MIANTILEPMKAIQVQCLEPTYLSKLLKFVEGHGLNALISMQGEWDEFTYFDYREFDFPRQDWEYEYVAEKQKVVRNAIELAHQAGLKFYAWRHELQMHNEHIRKLNPEILDYTYDNGLSEGTINIPLGFFDPEKDALWEFIQWRGEEFFRLFPKVDGIVLTCLTETKIPLWNLSKKMSKTEILARLLKTVIGVCENAQKDLIIRNWGAYRDPKHPKGNVILDALEKISAPSSIRMMEKSVEPDFPLGYPPNKGIADVQQRRRTIVELSLPQETSGGGTVPVCVPEEIKAVIQFSKLAGVHEFVARADWSPDTLQWSQTFHTLENINEVNLFAYLKLVNDSEVSLEKIWQEWGQLRGTSPMLDIMKESSKAARKLYGCFRNHASFPVALPIPQNLHSLILANARYFYTSLSEDLMNMERIKNPCEDDINEAMREKEEAICVYKNCLLKLNNLKSKIPQQWWEQMEKALRHAADVAELFKRAVALSLRYQKYLVSGEGKPELLVGVKEMSLAMKEMELPNHDMGKIISAYKDLDFVKLTAKGLQDFESLLNKK